MSESDNRSNLLCSEYCQNINIPCIGTSRASEQSGNYFGGYILVEYGDSWSDRIEEQEGILSEINNILDKISQEEKTIWRLQAIKNDETSKKNNKQIIIYRNTQKKSILPSLIKETHVLQSLENTELISLIIRGKSSEYKIRDDRDVILVCTHAERDVCCGKFGYPIYKYLKSKNIQNKSIWRTSHIGGHRTAPTMIEFNENKARYWGYLTPEIAEEIIFNLVISPKIIKKHYRGLAGLKPELQVVERNGWVKYGINWDQQNLIFSMKNESNNELISIHSSGVHITNKLRLTPEIIEIGMTKCAEVKPAKKYILLN